MNFLKSHWVWIATALAGAISALTPMVTQFVSAHPQYSVTVMALWGVATAWAKSPKS